MATITVELDADDVLKAHEKSEHDDLERTIVDAITLFSELENATEMVLGNERETSQKTARTSLKTDHK